MYIRYRDGVKSSPTNKVFGRHFEGFWFLVHGTILVMNHSEVIIESEELTSPWGEGLSVSSEVLEA